MLKRKGLIIALLSVVVLLVGTVGVAMAQGPKPPADSRSGGPKAFAGYGDYGDVSPMVRGWVEGDWRMGMQSVSLVSVTAEVTGLTVEEVIAALHEGQTYAQIAEAQGVDLQEIVDAFVAKREADLLEAVEAGRLTQEQVDEMLAEMAEHILEHLEASSWAPRPYGFSDGQGEQGEGASGWMGGRGRSGRSGPGCGTDSEGDADFTPRSPRR